MGACALPSQSDPGRYAVCSASRKVVITLGYGHADKLAGSAVGTPAAGNTPPIDPALFRREHVRRVLAERDIAALYRILRDAGITQRRIAELTGQSQSEVSEILKGRRVLAYDLLVRIAEGLGIPRELMGLGCGERGAYGGGDTVARPPDGVDEDMQRRDVLAVGTLATLGFVPSFAALLDPSARPGEVPLPSRLGASDVAEIRTRTRQLRMAAQVEGGQARAASAAAAYYRRLTAVPATEQVAHSLGFALAELDELAGWCCYDAGLDRHARWHYRTAVDLARRVGDDYRVASALRCAGLVDSRRDRPDDAMKLYQIAGVKLGNQDPDLGAWLDAVSAGALADMGHEQAADHLARARDGWQATDAVERADQNYQAALVYVRLGRLDVAEALTASVNGAGRVRPVGVFATILRATIHIQAGEPRGLGMAKSAIDAAAPLHSLRVRERLVPLAEALEARPGSDARELARMARQVATV